MKEKRILGIDIGGTNFRIGAVNAEGEARLFRKIPVREVFRTEDALMDLLACIEGYLAELGEEIAAVSIGFPATLNRERSRVLQAPNLPFVENLPVVLTLSERLGVPVFIERDVTMTLCYDVVKYGIPRQGITCGFYFGTGIGNAISVNGLPLIGKNGAAGELGHIPVDGSEEACGCGNIGCMENLAGGKYLARLRENIYPETPIGELFSAHGSEAELTQFVDRMAMAVATEINILDPDHVLIGGGVPAMKDFPTGLLHERILTHVRKPFPAQELEILYTSDIEEKGVVGAAWYANSKLNLQHKVSGVIRTTVFPGWNPLILR